MLAPRLEIRSPTPASRFQFLTVPGYGGSGPEHWQSQWERDDPSFGRVEQHDWDHPNVDVWTLAIEAAVRGAAKPVVFVAHSCGVTAVAHWTKRFGPDIGIAGAFLVAPPDFERVDLEQPVYDFGAPPLEPLPFPSMLVASEDDPYCDVDRARVLANAWGASFVSAGKCGHINTASGHGPWPEGKRLLNAFATQLKFG
jgi:predicted alpha/beta hydrolase family esterase